MCACTYIYTYTYIHIHIYMLHDYIIIYIHRKICIDIHYIHKLARDYTCIYTLCIHARARASERDQPLRTRADEAVGLWRRMHKIVEEDAYIPGKGAFPSTWVLHVRVSSIGAKET